MTDTTTAPRTYARIADLPEPVREAAAWLESIVYSPSAFSEDATYKLAALLGLPVPESDTDGLFECEHSDCANWFWREDGAARVTPDGERIVCAAHAEPDDHDVTVYPGSRLAERMGVAR